MVPPDKRRSVEIAVIGSGPGGAVTACLLAESGKDVLLVEEGREPAAGSGAPFSLEEMSREYRNGGLTVAFGATKIAYAEARVVGGGSEINAGLYHRAPGELLERWRRDFGVEEITEEELRPHFEAIEAVMGLDRAGAEALPASRKLGAGAEALGWKSIVVPRLISEEVGRPVRCSMSQTYLARAVASGCRIAPGLWVRRLRESRSKWILECRRAPEGAPIEIAAKTVFLCGGAIQTPALLRRSGWKRNIGNSLRLHPTVKVAARFRDEVNDASPGVPTRQVKEFSPVLSFGGSVSTLPHLALSLLEHPQALASVRNHWSHMYVYYAMITGNGIGSVRAPRLFKDPVVRFRLGPEDAETLASGVRKLSRLLLAAGATAVFPGFRGAPVIRKESDLARVPGAFAPAQANLVSLHLFSTCPMGENRRICAADSFGKVHGARGFYLSDASLLCTSLGVNPQGTIMAIARRNALRFLGKA